MRSKKTLFYLLLLCIIGVLNSTIRFFMFGSESFLGGDATRVLNRSDSFISGNQFNESEIVGKLGRDFGVQPPGYAIFMASMKLTTGLENQYLLLIFMIFGTVAFISLSFLLGSLLVNNNFGLICSLFSSISVVTFVFVFEEDSLLFSVGKMYPDLAGTNTDSIFVFSILLCLIHYFKSLNPNDDKYVFIIFILLCSYGLSHISRFLAMGITLIIVFTLLALYLSQRSDSFNSAKCLISSTVSLASVSFVYFYYYYSVFSNEGQYSKTASVIKERLPSFVSLSLIFYLIIIALLVSIIYLLIITINFPNKKVLNINFKHNYHMSLPLILLFGFSIISFIISIDSIGYAENKGIAETFFVQPYYQIGHYIDLYLATVSLLLLVAYFSAVKYFSRLSSFTIIFSLFFIVNTFFFLSSILVNFHPSRMSLLAYLRPFGFASLFVLLSNNFRHIPKPKANYIKIIILLVLILSQSLASLYINISSGTSINNIEYYDHRIQETSYLDGLSVSSNALSFLESKTEGEEYILSTPVVQEELALRLPIVYLGQDILNEWFVYETYNIGDFFEKYDSFYFIVTYSDTQNPLYENKLDYWNSLEYLDVVYTNSIGEVVYKYNSINS